MTLYEIDAAIIECTMTVDEETGEFLDAEKLEELQMARDEKLEGVACWIKNLTAENAAISVEQKNLAERKRVNENRIDNLKQYLAYALEGQKFSTGKVSVTFRKSETVEIADDAELSDEYLKTEVKITPDKTALKAALKDGQEIKGVSLQTHVNAQIK